MPCHIVLSCAVLSCVVLCYVKLCCVKCHVVLTVSCCAVDGEHGSRERGPRCGGQ